MAAVLVVQPDPALYILSLCDVNRLIRDQTHLKLAINCVVIVSWIHTDINIYP